MTPIELFLALLITHISRSYLSSCLTTPSTVYVSTNSNSSCQQVENATTTTPFRTDVLRSGTTVVFCTKVIFISEVVNVKNVRELFLLGLSGSGTKVKCLGPNAGFSFVNVTNVKVSNIEFVECGAIQNSTYVNVETNNVMLSPFLVTLFFLNCTDVNLVSIKVLNGNGTGLSFFDTGGKVNILHSLFENNTVRNSTLPGGSGVYIEFTLCPPGIQNCSVSAKTTKNNSYYRLINVTLFKNYAKPIHGDENATFHYQDPEIVSNGLGRGGGLSITFKGDAKNNTIKVTNCKFSSNTASDWGGGLYSIFQDSPQNNTLYVSNTEFIQNYCDGKSGGGMDIGFMLYSQTPPRGNNVVFENCSFFGNEAISGGGAALYSSHTNNSQLNNGFRLSNCRFQSNRAVYGSALEISPQIFDRLRIGFLPTTVIEDCVFESNIVRNKMSGSKQYIHGQGALLCTNYPLTFKKHVKFFKNNGSALKSFSCKLSFREGSRVIFSGNKGIEGGAMSLFALSSLEINNNSTFSFIDNSATRKGGAIIEFNVDSLNFETSKTCFIHYAGQTKVVSDRKIMFLFAGNIAGSDQVLEYGQSLFVSTLQPCKRRCRIQENSSEIFGCFGNFTFMENRKNEISTFGKTFELKNNTSLPIHLIPGRETFLPFKFQDELNNDSYDLYHVSIDTSNSHNIHVDPTYAYISDKNVTLFGYPHSSATLEVTTIYFQEIVFPIEIEMKTCPPGYVTGNTSKGITCVCSADLTGKKYVGIRHCSELEGKAFIKHGYWIGYLEDDKVSEDNLVTGYCPPTFCFENETKQLEHLLPVDASKTQLDRIVCGPTRTGNLCGLCYPGYSIFFHSTTFKCLPNSKCKVGPLLYIVSELLPVTIVFIVAIFFNIQFTSGAVNSLVFYYQFIDTMLVDANGIITFHPVIEILESVYRFVYGMLNLNFFNLNELSFCLWKGTTTLDVLAIKYVTIVYSFLLVCMTVLLVRICNARCNKISWNHSIIHGLTTFLVICYAQCTKVTLFILTPGRIYTMNQTNIAQVVFYNGELSFWGQTHLKYALVAIFFLITIVVLPPALLIVYPLCYKVFALFRLEETTCIRIVCKIMPLEKLKPLFDSFQGCFKDHFQFFAGTFFLYRLATLTGFTLVESLTKFYTVTGVFLIVILALHSVLQPYKQRWHNIVDVLLISDLAIINGLTMHNYKRANEQYDYGHEINIAGSFQITLIFLPLACSVLYIGVVTTLKVKNYCLNRESTPENKVESDSETFALSMIEYREHFMS